MFRSTLWRTGQGEGKKDRTGERNDGRKEEKRWIFLPVVIDYKQSLASTRAVAFVLW